MKAAEHRNRKVVLRGLLAGLALFVGILLPGAQIEARRYVGGLITANTVWTKANSPYIVTRDIYVGARHEQHAAVTLTIEKGVEVRFREGTGLYIGESRWPDYLYNGVLKANGGSTEAERIVFTADTATPQPGYWNGIWFGDYAQSEPSQLTNVTVRYGYDNIGCDSAVLNVTSSKILEGRDDGLDMNWCSGTISGNTIRSNEGNGLSVSGGTGSLENNTITGNGRNGVESYDSNMVVRGNTLSENTEYPIRARIASIEMISGNSGAGNGQDVIAVTGGRIEADTTWTPEIWNSSSFPYVITGLVQVYRSHSTLPIPTLTIQPGVTLRFEGNGGLQIGHAWRSTRYEGLLHAKGTAQSPISFISSKPLPEKGDWRGLSFYATPEGARNILEHCTVEHAQQNIHINKYASVTVANSASAGSAADGVFVDQHASSVELLNNTFNDNTKAAISMVPSGGGRLSGNKGTGNGLDVIEIRGGALTADTTWERQPLPYTITGHVTVAAPEAGMPAAKLTLGAGVKLQFKGQVGLYIGAAGERAGALSAVGEEYQPVVFTSTVTEPTPSYWYGLFFNKSTDAANTLLRHCLIEYVELVQISDSSPTIEFSEIRHNRREGISIGGQSAAPVIRENLIHRNGTHGILIKKYCNSWTGDCTGGGAEITRNRFADNRQSAIRMDATTTDRIYDNFGSGEATDYIDLDDSGVQRDSRWMKNDTSLPYVVSWLSISDYRSNTPPTLTLDPGVIVQFKEKGSLEVGYYEDDGWDSWLNYGGLNARGTEEQPILFTIRSDDPKPGSWQGLQFIGQGAQAKSLLEHCIIEYAGYSRYSQGNAISITRKAAPVIKNSRIRYSSGHGVYVDSSSPTLHDNFIHDNAQDGIYGNECSYWGCRTSGWFDNDSPLLMKGNRLFNNQGTAMNLAPYYVKYVGNNRGFANGENMIKIRQGKVPANSLWTALDPSSLPYVIAGDVTVEHHEQNKTATLVLEQGIKVAFQDGAGLYIGNSNAGALSARGEPGAKILLTSASGAPQPGKWKGIYFRDKTDDAHSFLEHTIVEYAGHTHNANVSLNQAAPTIQSNTIRAGGGVGIHVKGVNSSGANINCNNLSENFSGILLEGNAAPKISGNNFLGNTLSGAKNTGTATVHLENNWWGDALGPNQAGDRVDGPTAYDPWLPSESACILAPPTNSPPFEANTPQPAQGELQAALTNGTLELSWSGGDPNPGDSVTYDLLFGVSRDALSPLAQGLTERRFVHTGVNGGVKYFWKIVAHDDGEGLLQSESPVWDFITQGDPPDLTVSDLRWEPATGIQHNQEVTFTATVKNIGTGPLIEKTQVDFTIGAFGAGISEIPFPLFPGESVELSQTWTARTGEHLALAEVDKWQRLTESNEENNSFSRQMPPIQDRVPPALVMSIPKDGALTDSVAEIVFVLEDQHGLVDTAAVIGSVELRDRRDRLVAGQVTQFENRFTFLPQSGNVLPDQHYTLSLLAQDNAGNSQPYSITFTVDGQPPVAPEITGGSVVPSGLIEPGKANRSNSAVITLSGTREDDCSVWINDSRLVEAGSGDWSAELTLDQGANLLNVTLRDSSGNPSPVVGVEIFVDSEAPAAALLTPAHESALDTAPDHVRISLTEQGSGVDLANSLYSLRNSGMAKVEGEWSFDENLMQLSFTPAQPPLEDSTYTILLQLADRLDNRSGLLQYHFIVDGTPPPAPGIDPISSPVSHPALVIRGTKEGYAAIWLDGEEIVGHTAATSWQYPVTLTPGTNEFRFTARNRAGGVSEARLLDVVYGDLPPLPVTSLEVDAEGDGRSATIRWNSYDAAGQGDITGFRIYLADADFSQLTDLTPIAELGADIRTYTLEGLERNVPSWCAVVPVDSAGNTPESLSATRIVTVDTLAPEDVRNVRVESVEQGLNLFWEAPVGSDDLAGYKVYFDGVQEGGLLLPERTRYERRNLEEAAAYFVKITAIDSAGNESSGKGVSGITLLELPQGLSAAPQSGYVDLSWNSVRTPQYLKQYTVYVSRQEFTTVEGMTPRLTTLGTSARIAELTDGQRYYFAVTAVNSLDGERKAVTPLAATPEQDREGPLLSGFELNGEPLQEGALVAKTAKFTLNASDPGDVGRVEFFLEGASLARTLLCTDEYGVPAYTCYWDVATVEDGEYTLSVDASDSFGNTSAAAYTLTVSLEAPPAPVMTQPVTGTLSNQPETVVQGNSLPSAQVLLFLNDTLSEAPVTVDAQGRFSSTVTLAEGKNTIRAVARYRNDPALSSPQSGEVSVMLDTAAPPAPTHIRAESRPDGEIRLSWRAPSGNAAKGYRLYRGNSGFNSPEEAELLNPDALLSELSYTDLPAADGDYIYRLQSVSFAGNTGMLSDAVTGRSDRGMPEAASIVYTPLGQYDAAGGRFGVGEVEVTVTTSEALQTAPFLSVKPEQGALISVDLKKTGDLEYRGVFEIRDTTPAGLAYATFAARDLAGNLGTEIREGSTLLLDTAGPVLTRLSVIPASPIRNRPDAPVTLTVEFGLSDSMKAAEIPSLSYTLSGAGRTATALENITPIATQSGDAQTWRATLTLPADAGTGSDGSLPSEMLSFTYQGVDDLENMETRIQAENRVQIYQGELPALGIPERLSAGALAEGKIRLTWNAVEGAASYRIYRQAPEETELTLLTQIPPAPPLGKGGKVEYSDDTDVDGEYRYAVSSLREENGQTAESARSVEVSAEADGTAPAAPQNLRLTPVAEGIFLQWEDALNTGHVTYTLYRAAGTEISSVAGLNPAIPTVPARYLASGFLDEQPSRQEPCYVMTARDAVGNESAPSNSVYHEVPLLPLSQLRVRQVDGGLPVLSWEHPDTGALSGYDLYAGSPEQAVKVNEAPFAEQSYTDTAYTGEERVYTVVALGTSGEESLGRSVTLPRVRYSVVSGQYSGGSGPSSAVRIRRGVMNRVEYAVENLSANRIPSARLTLQVGGRQHQSDSFALEPGETKQVAVIVGGYADLPDLADITSTLVLTPSGGTQAELVQLSQIEVTDGMLIAQILNDEFTRGVSGTARFTLENTGDAEIDLLTASNAANSGNITLKLQDRDGNVLSSVPVVQASGSDVRTLSNGKTIARILPGERFTSAPVEIPVPLNAPDRLTLLVQIGTIYYHLGEPEEVAMTGLTGRQDLSLQDTSYYGEILTIAPERQITTRHTPGGEDVVISGRAVERATGQSLPEVPLKVVVTVQGFERSATVYTGADGTFSYTFTPLAQEFGDYTVRAVHPDLLDRPVHGTFAIERIRINPDGINLSLQRNYPKSLQVTFNAGQQTPAHKLRLEYHASDQPDGRLVPGMHLSLPQPVDVDAGGRAALPFTVWADATAPEESTLVLRIVSDDPDAGDGWGTVTVKTTLYVPEPPQPQLFGSPDFIENGLTAGTSVTETVTIGNNGAAELHEVALTLLNEDGTAAPEWAALNTPAALGTIPVGEEREIRLIFQPDENVAHGDYDLVLQIASAELETVSLPVFITITDSAIGDVMFKLSDIYTGWSPDENSPPSLGLQGATIRLRNEDLPTLKIPQRISNETGVAVFEKLPAGRYQCRITAEDHKEYSARFWVKPGLTTNHEAFIEYDLVSVEWEVSEIAIQDDYDITLKTTFKTNVPAAMVVAEPASVSLPEMAAGDVYYGEFDLVNHGLIRADNLQLFFPEDDEYYSYELLAGAPESLAAKERITLPFRVTRLKDGPGAQDGSGGGNVSCTIFLCAVISYQHECANGNIVDRTMRFCLKLYTGPCPDGASGLPSFRDASSWASLGGADADGDGTGLGWRPWKKGPFSGVWQDLGGEECYPEAGGRECWDIAPCMRPDDCQKAETSTGSWVNSLTRAYKTNAPSLQVRLPGGWLRVGPRYRQGQWQLYPANIALDGLATEKLRLRFHEYGDSKRGYVISGIVKDGNIGYLLPGENFALKTTEFNGSKTERYVYTGPQIYIHNTSYKIKPHGEGWRWTNKHGKWKEYDSEGRFLAEGNRYGATERPLYTPEGKIAGYADGGGNQVFWFDYHPGSGLLAAIRDARNRRIRLEYHPDGRLWKVFDERDRETRYEYSAEGYLQDVFKPKGKESHVTYNDAGQVTSVLDEQGIGFEFDYDYDERAKAYYSMVKDPEGNVKEVWFDDQGRPARVDYNGVTKQKIKREDNATIVTDEHGKVTRKEYDEWNNLKRVVYPSGKESVLEYERTYQRLIERKNADGTVDRFIYDDENRTERRILAEGTSKEKIQELRFRADGSQESFTETVSATGETEEIGYTSFGKQKRLKNASGEWIYHYNEQQEFEYISGPDGSRYPPE